MYYIHISKEVKKFSQALQWRVLGTVLEIKES